MTASCVIRHPYSAVSIVVPEAIRIHVMTFVGKLIQDIKARFNLDVEYIHAVPRDHTPTQMTEEQTFIGKRIDRLLELPRLAREGATLKNVSDNMRALTACIAMFIAIGLAYKSPFIAGKVIALLWGCWTFVYAALACLQAGILFGTALQDFLPRKHLYTRFKNARYWIIYFISCLAVYFVFGAVFLILYSLENMSIK